MIFILGIICGMGISALIASAALFLKVIPDFQKLENEIERLKGAR